MNSEPRKVRRKCSKYRTKKKVDKRSLVIIDSDEDVITIPTESPSVSAIEEAKLVQVTNPSSFFSTSIKQKANTNVKVILKKPEVDEFDILDDEIDDDVLMLVAEAESQMDPVNIKSKEIQKAKPVSPKKETLQPKTPTTPQKKSPEKPAYPLPTKTPNTQGPSSDETLEEKDKKKSGFLKLLILDIKNF